MCACAVDIDWAVNEDFPIFKKYGVMNSGLLDSTRYNKTIFDSLAVVKVTPCNAKDVSAHCGAETHEKSSNFTLRLASLTTRASLISMQTVRQARKSKKGSDLAGRCFDSGSLYGHS